MDSCRRDCDGIPLNRYFIDHPEMICGEMQMLSGPYGQRPTCAPLDNGTSLEGQLDTALANLQTEYTLVDDRKDAQEESDTLDADPDTRNFSYVVKDDTVYYRENSKMRAVKASTPRYPHQGAGSSAGYLPGADSGATGQSAR